MTLIFSRFDGLMHDKVPKMVKNEVDEKIKQI